MNLPSDEQLERALISIVIEKVLLGIGRPEYLKVVKKLHDQYQCYLSDCYNNPQYLKNVLKSIFGNSYNTIYESIKIKLNEVESHRQISNFLKVLEE